MKYTIPISKEQYDEWLDALRSGDFKQTDVVLTRVGINGQPDSHCCLGVLCEVMGLEKIRGINYVTYIHGDKESTASLPFGDDTDFSHVGVLPRYSDWSLEQQKKFDNVHLSVTATLTLINDSGEFTFIEIAEIIESFFEPLQ